MKKAGKYILYFFGFCFACFIIYTVIGLFQGKSVDEIMDEANEPEQTQVEQTQETTQTVSIKELDPKTVETELTMLDNHYNEIKTDISNLDNTDESTFIKQMDDQIEFAQASYQALKKDYANSYPQVNLLKEAWTTLIAMCMSSKQAIENNDKASAVTVVMFDQQYEDYIQQIKNYNGEDFTPVDPTQEQQWLSTLEQDKSAVEQLYTQELAPEEKAEKARQMMSEYEQQYTAIMDKTGNTQVNYPLIRGYVDVREMAVAIKHIAEDDEAEKFQAEYNEANSEATKIIDIMKR